MRNRPGAEIGGAEAELVAVCRSTHRPLTGQRAEPAPYLERNALEALSCPWQIVNGLDVEPEQLYHVGV